MTAAVRFAKGPTLEFSRNNKISESLSRGNVYREIYLRLQGQLTVTAANNTAAKTKRGDEWAVVKRIDIRANGTNVIKSFSGNTLWWLNYFLYGVPPQVTRTLGDGSTANPSFDVTLVLPFWIPRSVRPMDTALDSSVLSSLEIEVTWGTHTDINGDATGFTTEPTVEMYTQTAFNIQGPFSQWRVFEIQKEITADNDRFQIQLPVGHMYRGFLLNFTDADADDGAVLNEFRWVSGSTTFSVIEAEVLQQAQRVRNSLVRPFDDGGGVYDDLRRGDDNDVLGWYMYDHVQDGRNTEAIDTLGFSEHTLELNVTKGAGDTKVFVYPFELIPVRSG